MARNNDSSMEEWEDWEDGEEDIFLPSNLPLSCTFHCARRAVLRGSLVFLSFCGFITIVTIDTLPASTPGDGYSYLSYRLFALYFAIATAWNSAVYLIGAESIQLPSCFQTTGERVRQLLSRDRSRSREGAGDAILLVVAVVISSACSIEINRSVCAPEFYWCLTLNDLCIMAPLGYLPHQYTGFGDFICPVPQITAATVMGFLSCLIYGVLIRTLNTSDQLRVEKAEQDDLVMGEDEGVLLSSETSGY